MKNRLKMKNRSRTAAAILLSLMAALSFSTGALADRAIAESCEASASGTVLVENVSGVIVVEGWDRSQVQVSGTVEDGVEEVQVQCDSGKVTIKVILPRNGGRKTSADLQIQVPSGSEVGVETVSADQRVSGVSGALDLESVSGEVVAEGQPKALNAETVSGKIDFRGESVRVDVESVSGDIGLAGVSGEVSASSVSGDVTVDADTVDRARFETVSGDLSFAGSLGGQARLNAESHSGRVVLNLPGGTSAEFEVETYSGSLSSDFGGGAGAGDGPGKSWSFSTGSDGRISVETFSGDVKLRQR